MHSVDVVYVVPQARLLSAPCAAHQASFDRSRRDAKSELAHRTACVSDVPPRVVRRPSLPAPAPLDAARTRDGSADGDSADVLVVDWVAGNAGDDRSGASGQYEASSGRIECTERSAVLDDFPFHRTTLAPARRPVSGRGC